MDGTVRDAAPVNLTQQSLVRTVLFADRAWLIKSSLSPGYREQVRLGCSNGDRESTIFCAVLRQRRTPSTAGAAPRTRKDGAKSSTPLYQSNTKAGVPRFSFPCMLLISHCIQAQFLRGAPKGQCSVVLRHAHWAYRISGRFQRTCSPQ